MAGPIGRSGGTGDGERTRLLILDASADVLRAHGAAGYSVPKVAAAVRLTQGTVTHYFATRRDLLVATARHVAERYSALVREQVGALDTSDVGWAEGLLRWLCDDAVLPPTVELFPELWSLARTDPGIARSVAGIYTSSARDLVTALGHDPDDPRCGELNATVWVAASLSEGMTAVHAGRALDDPVYRTARDTAIAMLAPRLHAAHVAAPRRDAR